MKKFAFLGLIAILAICCLTSCNCNTKQAGKEKVRTDKECSTLVTVMDYRGLSSCGYLLRLKNGEELSVQGGVSSKQLENTATAYISYEPIKEPYPNSCMRGQQVKVTCFKVDKEGTPRKGDF